MITLCLKSTDMKRIIKKTGFYLIILTIAFAIVSCGEQESPRQPEEFLISVDSISLPDSLNIGQVLKLGFYGTIGDNQCYRFKRFIVGKSMSGYSIKVIGEQSFPKGGDCAEGAVLLEGRVLELPVTDSGTQLIEVENPGLNQIIRKEVVFVP
jgi:hypothetical protein